MTYALIFLAILAAYLLLRRKRKPSHNWQFDRLGLVMVSE